MSDERMDERLRDYAARWTAARPEPSMPAAGSPGRRAARSWVPYAAAAAVVALVAGVALAVSPRDRAEPPAAAPASPSPRPSPSYPPCGEGDVKSDLRLTRDDSSGGVDGTLDIRATGAPCRLPESPVVDIVGENRRDLGVEYRFRGENVPYVVAESPRRLLLRWEPAFCPGPPSLMVGIVTLSESLGFKQPLDPKVSPKCYGTRDSKAGSTLTAQWEGRLCTNADWEVVGSEAVTVPAGDGSLVRFTAVLRNVSDDFCQANLKALLRLVDGNGREVHVTNAPMSDARFDPPVMPGRTVRASMRWTTYCGPPLGAYRTFLRLPRGVDLEFEPGSRPLPPCLSGGGGPGADGAVVYGDWLDPVE